MSSLKQIGFGARGVYRVKKPRVFHLAKQKLSFMVASFSLFAFVMGNMVGQHGWYAFWKTVLGKEDDSLIAFVGTVSPIAKIPDYTAWSQYGGDKRLHTFNQVPTSVLRDLPAYDQTELTAGGNRLANQAYSTLWAGGYNSPSGSHAGVDIDAPRGTPVVAIANGVIEKASMQGNGFGNHIMIRHPNVPSDGGTTTLRSTYAHLDTVLVSEGDIVHKGQIIGTVGNTGLVFGATGYHLYFQVDIDEAPFHPYWPFTSGEISEQGTSFMQAVNGTQYQSRVLQYTISPMDFVEKYAGYIPPTNIVRTNGSTVGVTAQAPASYLSGKERLKQAVAARRAQRGGRTFVASTLPPLVASSVSSSVASSAASSTPSPSVQNVVVTAQADEIAYVPSAGVSNDVDHMEIRHSGTLTRTWQKVQVVALDRNGDVIQNPSFSGRLYVIAEFGEAVIRPTELSPLDFVNGVATVHILPRADKTLILGTRGAFSTVSAPMVFSR